MESTFYSICDDSNLDFPEVYDIASEFSKVFDEFGRPDPDNDIELYRKKLPEMLSMVSDRLRIKYVYCALNILVFTDGVIEDEQEVIRQIKEAHMEKSDIEIIE